MYKRQEVEGEEGFREREKKILKEISRRDNSVISTGGGIVVSIENREIIRSKGKVIYLETPIKLQLERTLNDKKRPLLSQINKEDVLRSLKKIRDPLYRDLADITIKQKGKKHNQIVSEILDKLNKKIR